MPKTRRYPPEIRERAVRLVLDQEHEYLSQCATICSIAERSEINRETLRRWVAGAARHWTPPHPDDRSAPALGCGHGTEQEQMVPRKTGLRPGVLESGA